MHSYIDLHIHSTSSDGTDSVPQILEKVQVLGLQSFSICDHDTIEGSQVMEALVPPELRYLRGIEFSCISPEGKCHILGYDYNPADALFQKALETGRQLRQDKLNQRLAFLRECFGIILTAEESRWLNSQKSPGKPHLGQIIFQRGLAPDLDTAIQKYVNPCKGGHDRIDAELAIKAILHAGGIPIWAHPLGGEGERRLSAAEFDAQFRELAMYGLRGLECYYSRYDRDDISFLVGRANAHNLLVSGGSDYHGSNKTNIGIGKLSCDNLPVDPVKLTVLQATHTVMRA